MRRRERAKRQEEQQKNWTYNPYASEPIKHFADLSRSEIDKLMVRMQLDRETKQRRDEEMKEKKATELAKKTGENNNYMAEKS